MSAAISFRFDGERLERLRRVARAMNRTASEAAVLLVEEGLRLREFPGVEFRDTPIGRQAFLRGTRLGIWQIVTVADEHGREAAATAEHLGIAPHEVALALAYTDAYRDEIDAAIADIRAANERLAGLAAPDEPGTGLRAGAGA